METQSKDDLDSRQAAGRAAAAAAPADWPIEARISHRVLLYAARCAPRSLNQFTIEEIVKEEIAKEPNTEHSGTPPAQH